MQKRDRIGVTPFKLDTRCVAEPSEFEVVFVRDGERYVYGFAADANKVHEEWLTLATPTRPASLFHRSAVLPDGCKFGTKWKGQRVGLVSRTPDHALLLSVAQLLGNPSAQTVYDWFKQELRGISDYPEASSEFTFSLHLSETSPESKARIGAILRKADLGIRDFEIREVRASEDAVRTYETIREALVKVVGDVDVLPDMPTKQVRTLHEARSSSGDTVDVDFSFSEESSGTQRLFALAGPWFYTLLNGTTLMIDEIDSKLHPLLTRMLVRMFCDRDTNPHNAQLVFTTHDASLLDAGLLRRDQVWFTEKDQSGATELYSLWDYRVRKDENFRHGYLSGKYGAIPFIGEYSFDEDDTATARPPAAARPA